MNKKTCRGMAVGSLVVRASDSRPEGLGTGEYFPPLQFTCRNCGGGDRGRVAIYRPFGEFHRAKIALSPVWCSRPTTGVPLAHATMNFVCLDLTTSDRRKDRLLSEEDTTKSYSGVEPEPIRLQAEGHSHHTGWATDLLTH
ncbi:hypothetical protein TNCV_1642341 [Trichonephila clavipes]|nr:hypothetical protein TNCV_1642341 [Trichonephila clavipes]